MRQSKAEYIWLDGSEPTKKLRSKTRVIEYTDTPTLDNFPQWGFDGSSTNQASGDNSDCLLEPVSFVHDPIRGQGHYLVMCEVLNADGSVHSTNTRAVLRRALEQGGAQEDFLFGFEQEYTLLELDGTPHGWPTAGFPEPQGPYYCGVGAARIAGRSLVEAHLDACIEAGLLIYGVNAEVMLGQWEYQIGYRGFNETADPLTTTDHMWFAQYIMNRLSEDYDLVVSFANKPMKGDWNGAGCHANFSTKSMRDKSTGKTAVDNALKALESTHQDHIKIYGAALDERLTGDHETCDINTFKSGNSDRGASIRIPVSTAEKGYGYLEDRRPGANIDSYLVAARIIATLLNQEFQASVNSQIRESVTA